MCRRTLQAGCPSSQSPQLPDGVPKRLRRVLDEVRIFVKAGCESGSAVCLLYLNPCNSALLSGRGGFSFDPCRHDFAQFPPKPVGHQPPLRIAIGAGSTPMVDFIAGKSPLRDGLTATLARAITIEHRQPWHIKCAGKDGEGRANAKSRGTGASGRQRAGSGLGPRRVDREQIRCAGEHSACSIHAGDRFHAVEGIKKEGRRASCGALKSSQSPRGNPHAPHGRMPRPRTPGRPVRLRRPHGSGGRLHARPPGLAPAVAAPGRGRALPRHRAAGLRPLHMADAFPVREGPTPTGSRVRPRAARSRPSPACRTAWPLGTVVAIDVADRQRAVVQALRQAGAGSTMGPRHRTARRPPATGGRLLGSAVERPAGRRPSNGPVVGFGRDGPPRRTVPVRPT